MTKTQRSKTQQDLSPVMQNAKPAAIKSLVVEDPGPPKKRLLDRLERLDRTLPQTLQHVLTLELYNQMLDFVVSRLKSCDDYLKTTHQSLYSFKYKQRNVYCNLVKHLDGEFALIVEPRGFDKDGKQLTSEFLGKGGFKKVYKAYRLDTPAPTVLAGAVIRESRRNVRVHIDAEITALKQLEHPNLIRYSLSLIRDYNSYSTVTLYSEAARCSLSEYVKCETPSEVEKYKLLYSVAQGVAFLNRNDKVHQDLKPTNILVYSSGTVKICDFGLVDDTSSKKWATTTPGYASPEMLHAYRCDNPSLNDFHMAYPRFVGVKMSERFKSKRFVAKSRHPHPKNDAFALGMVMAEVFNIAVENVEPKTFELETASKRPMIHHLTRWRRADRWDACQLLTHWDRLKNDGDGKQTSTPRAGI